jgi:hypothetical protein
MTVPIQYELPQRGLDRLLYQFKDSKNYQDLVAIYLGLQQEIETIAFEVLRQKDINLATGLSLDFIGRVVGISRNNLSDDAYRQQIIIKIFINNSKGTISDVQNIVKLLTQSNEVKVFEVFPAAISLYISGEKLTEEQRQIVPLIVAAGVRVGATLVAGGRQPWIPPEIDNLLNTGILPEVGEDLPDTRIPIEAVI